MKKRSVFQMVLFMILAGVAVSPAGAQSTKPRVLVVYFSHSGNTTALANTVHNLVGGDIFEVIPAVPYPKQYREVLQVAQAELKRDARPKLATSLTNPQDYDVIFLGYPIWLGTLPMAMFTFLNENNFAGKVIIPFCTHEGSGLGVSEKDIARLSSGATLKPGIAIRGSRVKDATGAVKTWLAKSGFPQ